MKMTYLLVLIGMAAVTGGIIFGCVKKSIIMEKPWIIIDVRTSEEFSAGHLKKAVNIPYETIGSRISAVVPAKESPVLLYCRSGRRSGIAYETLKSLGYKGMTNAGAYEKLRKRFGLETKIKG